MVRNEAVEQRAVQLDHPEDAGDDPRVTGLGDAVRRLRIELDAHPAQLRDRHTAEESLDALTRLAASGVPELPDLYSSLLRTVAALGSVSALSAALAEVLRAVELLGVPGGVRERRETSSGRSA